MTRTRLIAGGCLLCLAMVGTAPVARTADGPRCLALLVGVTRYANNPNRTLEGPANDVTLLAQLLQGEPFRVPAPQITILSEAQKDPNKPTYANIQREFQRLAREAKTGDIVFIAMSGHGSQQPAAPDDVEEPDGLDELFLPADVGKWNGEIGGVDHAIVDKTMRDWLTAIRNTGAFVWIVFDSCHSGTMTRGGERMREILPNELGIPDTALQRASATAKARGGTQATPSAGMLKLKPGAGTIVAMYAAQDSEETPEMRLPNATSPWQGLFTYTMAEVLKQSTSPITYRELATRVAEHYRTIGRIAPTPSFEGDGIDREVLGQRTWPDRPTLVLHHAAEKLELAAGSLNGLHVGDVLAVYPPAGTAGSDKVSGHVTITGIGTVTSTVEPCDFSKMTSDAPVCPIVATSRNLPDASRCAVVYNNFGEFQLRVAVLPERAEPNPALRDALHANAALLAQMVREAKTTSNGMATSTDDPSAATWFLGILPGSRIGLISPVSTTTAAATARDADLRPFVVGSLDEARVPAPSANEPTKLSTKLGTILQGIGRAQALLQLVSAPIPDSGDKKTSIEVVALRSADAKAAGQALVTAPGGRVLNEGEWVRFQLRNTGTTTADVTLLFIAADYGIAALYPNPTQIADNSLPPNATLTVGPFQVNAQPSGIEQVVVIAAEQATQGHINFVQFAQPALTIEGTRGPTSRGGSASTPLGRLLSHAMDGGTRGLTPDLGGYAIQSLSWRTVPKPGVPKANQHP